MAVASPLSRKTVSVALPMTIKLQQDSEETEEPWFRNPWVWLIIAIPALTVVAGLLTLYLAITNPHIMVSDTATDDTSTTRSP